MTYYVTKHNTDRKYHTDTECRFCPDDVYEWTEERVNRVGLEICKGCAGTISHSQPEETAREAKHGMARTLEQMDKEEL